MLLHTYKEQKTGKLHCQKESKKEAIEQDQYFISRIVPIKKRKSTRRRTHIIRF